MTVNPIKIAVIFNQAEFLTLYYNYVKNSVPN